MRLIVTADLHVNHARSRPLAEKAIEEINQTRGDGLLLVGDTATGEGDALEEALSRITFDGPKLFVAGNHELWSRQPDTLALFEQDLPRRVEALGWHWLEGRPIAISGVSFVGSVGWYDYSFAPPSLRIPHRFYAAKISPGAAERTEEWQNLLEEADDVPVSAMEIVARWNDGKHVRLGMSDEDFLGARLAQLQASLDGSGDHIVAAVHHVPFAALLPPRATPTWDFARAYLGTERLGQLLAADRRVSHLFCGHSHFPIETTVGHVRAINIGSGYRQKFVKTVDL